MSFQRDMVGRAPGNTTLSNCAKLRPGRPEGYVVAFNPQGGGCGAAMRSMCIGLLYHSPEKLNDLIAVSVESGRMTHNHPTGTFVTLYLLNYFPLPYKFSFLEIKIQKIIRNF